MRRAFLIVVASLACSRQQDPEARAEAVPAATAASTPAAAEEVAVTAAAIFADYDANEVAADLKYRGKVIRVSGTVKSIDKVRGRIVVRLSGGKPIGGVAVNLTDADAARAAALSKGDALAVRCGRARKMMVSVEISDCSIAP